MCFELKQTNKHNNNKTPTGESVRISTAVYTGLLVVAAFLIATRHLLQRRGWGSALTLSSWGLEKFLIVYVYAIYL